MSFVVVQFSLFYVLRLCWLFALYIDSFINNIHRDFFYGVYLLWVVIGEVKK